MFHRYSDDTIEAVELLDNDEKIDLELIVALIRHIVHNEQVSLTVCLVSGQQSESGKIRVSWSRFLILRDGNGIPGKLFCGSEISLKSPAACATKTCLVDF